MENTNKTAESRAKKMTIELNESERSSIHIALCENVLWNEDKGYEACADKIRELKKKFMKPTKKVTKYSFNATSTEVGLENEELVTKLDLKEATELAAKKLKEGYQISMWGYKVREDK